MQFQPPSAPLLHFSGYSALVRPVSAPRHPAPFTAPPAGGPRRPPVRYHYCQNLSHVKAECCKLQRAQQVGQQRAPSPSAPFSAPSSLSLPSRLTCRLPSSSLVVSCLTPQPQRSVQIPPTSLPPSRLLLLLQVSLPPIGCLTLELHFI